MTGVHIAKTCISKRQNESDSVLIVTKSDKERCQKKSPQKIVYVFVGF